jgi:hypothetical protein
MARITISVNTPQGSVSAFQDYDDTKATAALLRYYDYITAMEPHPEDDTPQKKIRRVIRNLAGIIQNGAAAHYRGEQEQIARDEAQTQFEIETDQ